METELDIYDVLQLNPNEAYNFATWMAQNPGTWPQKVHDYLNHAYGIMHDESTVAVPKVSELEDED